MVRFFTTLLGAFLLSNAAQAVYVPGWERPIASAQMNIVNQIDLLTEHQVANVAMHQSDGDRSISFRVSLDQSSSSFLVVEAPRKDECGVVHYKARSVDNHSIYFMLSDHSESSCVSTAGGTWLATLFVVEEGGVTKQANLVGEAQPVFTIQSIQ